VPSELAYGLVLLAAAAQAGWNAWLKAADDRLLTMAAIRTVGLCLGVAALPFVPAPDPESWRALAAAALAHYAYYGLLFASYRAGDLGIVHGIARGTSPLVLVAVGWAVLDERLTAGQTAAVLLSCGGIGLLALGAGATRIAVGLALATGLSIAAYSFLGGVGVRRAGTALGFQAWLEIATGIGVVAWTWATRDRAAIRTWMRRNACPGLVAGFAAVGSYLAYLSAVTVLPIAPVAALRESSVLFSALIGAIAFRERFGARRVLGAFLVASGIVALSALGP
jgi:drug/metabolite transporter (DMT)-like permease